MSSQESNYGARSFLRLTSWEFSCSFSPLVTRADKSYVESFELEVAHILCVALMLCGLESHNRSLYTTHYWYMVCLSKAPLARLEHILTVHFFCLRSFVFPSSTFILHGTSFFLLVFSFRALVKKKSKALKSWVFVLRGCHVRVYLCSLFFRGGFCVRGLFLLVFC